MQSPFHARAYYHLQPLEVAGSNRGCAQIANWWCEIISHPIRGDRPGSQRHSHPTTRPNCAELNMCPFEEFSLNDIQKQVSNTLCVWSLVIRPLEQTRSNSDIAE